MCHRSSEYDLSVLQLTSILTLQSQKKKRKNVEENTNEADLEEDTPKPSKRFKKLPILAAEEPTRPRVTLRIPGTQDVDNKERRKGKAESVKKGSKRKRDEEEAKSAASDVVIEIESESKKKKGRKSLGKKAAAKEEVVQPPKEAQLDTPGDADRLYLDIAQWKSERESLDGSFDAARALFTLYGPWKLPQSISSDKFAEIAKATLAKMDR